MRTTNDLRPASMRSSAPATWCHEAFSLSGSLSTDKRNDFALQLTAAAFPITPCMPRSRSHIACIECGATREPTSDSKTQDLFLWVSCGRTATAGKVDAAEPMV